MTSSSVLTRLTHTSARRRRATTVGAAGLAAALVLSACGSSGDDSDTADAEEASGSGSDSSFEPVTIDHAFGTTEIDEQPERVVTWGWGSTDAAIALGTVPVAMPTNTYGGDEEGVLPWVREALEEQDAEVPTLLAESEEPPYEEILAAQPDVILAHYSGITEDQWNKLEAIAPTVAYPGEAWSTPWRDVVTTTGEVLGKSGEAEQLLSDIDSQVSAAAEEHPEFEGTSIAAVATDGTTFYVYTPADPRVEYLEDLGFESAPSVEELDTGESTFFYTLSLEELDRLDSDVLLAYADDETQEELLTEADETATLPQRETDRIATIVGQSNVSSVSPPTALSLTWGLDDFVEELSEAVTD